MSLCDQRTNIDIVERRTEWIT